MENGFAVATEFLPLPVGSAPRGTLQPLRSSPITEPSTLLQAAPPLCPASVLWSLRVLPLGRLPWQRNDRFSRSIQEPDPASRRLHAGCRSGGLQDSPRTDPGGWTTLRF